MGTAGAACHGVGRIGAQAGRCGGGAEAGGWCAGPGVAGAEPARRAKAPPAPSPGRCSGLLGPGDAVPTPGGSRCRREDFTAARSLAVLPGMNWVQVAQVLSPSGCPLYFIEVRTPSFLAAKATTE